TRFPRPEQHAVILGLRPVQVALVLAAIGMVTLSFVIQVPPSTRLGAVMVAVLCGMVAFGRAEELPVYRWLVLRGIHGWRSLLGRQSYRAGVLKPREHGRLQLPGEGGKLRILTSASGLGVVHDPR